MGIKYFFKWFKDSFPNTIKPFYGESNLKKGLLLLDLNGIIHTSCQKIYKYGSFEPKSLLRKSPPVHSGEKDLTVYEDILDSISSLVTLTDPQEIVLCIDGVAPVSKQIQQRQRRFLSKKTNGGFDSNCISPGTDFLYKLGLYLKASIKTNLEKKWLNVTTIYFMDSLVPGEGEHKLFDFLRSNQSRIKEKNYNIIVVGNDADLIMLSLIVSVLFFNDPNASQTNQIYILREDLTTFKNYDIDIDSKYLMVDINHFKNHIFEFAMVKPNFNPYDFEHVIADFVILCFMVGNDFLPSIPLFNIYDGGLDLMMKYYFSTPDYITFKNVDQSKLKINFKKLNGVFKHILSKINPQAIQHYKTREYGYKNVMLDVASKKEILINDLVHHYLKAYSIHHNINKNLVQAYLKEIKWIFNYYAYGSATVNWETYYPSQFAPTALDLLRNNHKKSSQRNKSSSEHGLQQQPCGLGHFSESGGGDIPLSPFFQLLCILPPHSADLLPQPLNQALCEKMDHFHPKEINIDYDGKLNDWEGIPILPPLNYDEVLSIYEANVNLCSKTDLKKNKVSKQLKISIA